ncbi:hypothetical protein [Paeniglutamicibacter kerguelensis]|uniref:Uncharacterized protein n=1 Tax=Paeniglutamicibacter kerguelensis TaxID=254788 RepID=A0ABS4XAR5_9MICC|nr:hypothetical protein [Paeniglutamicibacter kerguelensis]MBP2385562.1 hypothetical protein [Paeniglutamicibacter kerguelensis]
MASSDFTSSRDSSEHDVLVWRYVENMSDQEILSIMVHAETKVESIAHGRLLVGRPIATEVRNRLVQSAILREINLRAS